MAKLLTLVSERVRRALFGELGDFGGYSGAPSHAKNVKEARRRFFDEGSARVSLYETLARPLIFRLPPERAHALCKPALRNAALCRLLGGVPVRDARLAVRIGPLTFANPVGLAPGFDKGGELTTGLSRLGFGYLVVGSATPQPRSGNPQPRIVRLPEQRAIVNCMGLPGKGVDAFAVGLAAGRPTVPVVASFGGYSDDEFLASFALLQPVADALEVNQRCANNPDDKGGRQEAATFEPVLKALTAAKRKPLRVKLDAYVDESQLAQRLTMLELLQAYGVDGVALPTNYLVPNAGLSRGIGNISGAVLFERTLAYVRTVYQASRGRIAIHARGGISSGAQAFEAIAAGASTVELFTAFVYQGPGLANRINRELLAIMVREGVSSVRELRGARAGTAAGARIAEASPADLERVTLTR
jgi:dihydroorotate dehydrogenase